MASLGHNELKQSWFAVKWPIRNTPQHNLNPSVKIFFQSNAFENGVYQIYTILRTA